MVTLRATDWVGLVVLLFTLTALWTTIRGSRVPALNVRTRVVGCAALAGIVLSFWVGVTLHVLPAAVLMAIACSLCLWSVLLRFGVSWQQHIRPGIVSAVLMCVLALGSAMVPSIVAGTLLLLGFWIRRTYRRARFVVDLHLNQLTTRALVLAHLDPAAYLANTSFQRFSPRATNLMLLILAQRSHDRMHALPRARATLNAYEGLRITAALADNAIDQRLRTDGASRRASSWIRVLALEFGRQLLHRSGVVWLFRFLSGLLLALPPEREDAWNMGEAGGPPGYTVPDPEGYVVALVADLPRDIKQEHVDGLRDRVTSDAASSGRNWLANVARRAEEWREEITSHRRDLRVEIVGEVIWGVYEAALGPRPERYELFDELRLQAPELVEGLSVRDAKQDEKCLRLCLNGIPRAFHELSESTALTLRTRDERVWSFQQFETSDTGVELVFSPLGTDIEVSREPAVSFGAPSPAPASVSGGKEQPKVSVVEQNQ